MLYARNHRSSGGLHLLISFPMKKFTLFLLIISLYANLKGDCGFISYTPQRVINELDGQGYFFKSFSLANARLSGGGDFDVRLEWQLNAANKSSSCAGRDFFLPFFDASVVRVDDVTWKVFKPDGYWLIFKKTKEDGQKVFLESGNSWKGSIIGNRFTMTTSCGASFTYVNGEIHEAKVKNDRFVWRRDGDSVVDVVDNGSVFVRLKKEPNQLSISTNKGEGCVVALRKASEVGGDSSISVVSISPAKGPAVAVSAQAVGGRMMAVSFGSSERYVYDTQTGDPVEDLKYRYSIRRDSLSPLVIDVRREAVRAPGFIQRWAFDGVKGEEFVQLSRLFTKKTYRFTSGQLLGEVKALEYSIGGVAYAVQRVFDENGGFLFIRDDLGLVRYSDGRVDRALDYNEKVIARFRPLFDRLAQVPKDGLRAQFNGAVNCIVSFGNVSGDVGSVDALMVALSDAFLASAARERDSSFMSACRRDASEALAGCLWANYSDDFNLLEAKLDVLKANKRITPEAYSFVRKEISARRAPGVELKK